MQACTTSIVHVQTWNTWFSRHLNQPRSQVSLWSHYSTLLHLQTRNMGRSRQLNQARPQVSLYSHYSTLVHVQQETRGGHASWPISVTGKLVQPLQYTCTCTMMKHVVVAPVNQSRSQVCLYSHYSTRVHVQWWNMWWSRQLNPTRSQVSLYSYYSTRVHVQRLNMWWSRKLTQPGHR